MNIEKLSGTIDPIVLETALEISSEVIWELQDIDGVAEYNWHCSAANAEKYDIPEGKSSEDSKRKKIHANDQEQVLSDFYVAYHDSSIDFLELNYRIHGRNHIVYDITDKIRFLRDLNGQVVRVIGVWKDVSTSLIQKDIEDEFKQINEQLSLNLKEISEREFILNESQRLAKIASWNYDCETDVMFWSDEMYNIYGIDKSFRKHDPMEMFQMLEYTSTPITPTIFEDINALPVDLTAFLITPAGFKKWVRTTAYPIQENGRLIRVIGLTYDITHSKEVENRLTRSEEKFSKAFQNNPDLMTIHRESDSLVIDANKHLERVLGYTREEVIGYPARSFNFFLEATDRNSFYIDYNEDGAAFIETQWRKKDGSIVVVEITSTRVEINGENYSLNSIKDITSHKADKERFQKAFDLSPDLMLICRERDRVFIDVNSKLEVIVGYIREDIIGKSSNDFALWVEPNERNHFFSELNHSDLVSMEALFRKKNGEHFWGVISTSRIQLSGENHFLSVVRDVTEKKIIDEKIRENEAKLNAIINNTDLSIWSIDTDYRLTTFNNAFNNSTLHTFGRKYEIGTHLLHEKGFLSEEHIAFWQQLYNRAFTGEIVSEEYEMYDQVLHTSLHPIFNNGKVIGASIYSRDITEQKRAEQKLLQSEANLNATVNNTTLFVWSVDREFKLIMCNDPYREYTKEYYGITLEYGKEIIPEDTLDPTMLTLREKWIELCKRAMSGEIVKNTEEVNNAIFEYSLCPIIQSKRITGVSIFAEDVTVRVQKEKELVEANKKIGEYKLMALRSVMNPHFIFNALNSVQYFILDNDKRNAINYLSTFSKLIRGILNNTLENKITLREEIEQLKYYINLEQLRFEDKIRFILTIDTELNIDEVEIPSLLIQPYIENAILHGLCNKKGGGTLRVSISEKHNTILFEIEDDGVGRAAAMEFRSQNLAKHKSMGTALTEERLKLINVESNVSFEIEDLTKDGIPAGTKVSIWVKEC